MNKEDIWIARVPVPIHRVAESFVDDNFSEFESPEDLDSSNIYSPSWAPVSVNLCPHGIRSLVLGDFDRFDYSKVEKVFTETGKVNIEFSVMAGKKEDGLLHAEVQDRRGKAPPSYN